jgi:hypothetical protein
MMEHREQAGGGQQQRHEREAAEQPARESPGRQRAVDQTLQRRELQDARIGIELPHLLTHGIGQRERLAARAHDQVTKLVRNLSVGKVHVEAGILNPPIAGVLRDAHDGQPFDVD